MRRIYNITAMLLAIAAGTIACCNCEPSRPAAPIPEQPCPVCPTEPQPRPWPRSGAPVGADELAMDVPQSIRQWFKNPDGSCVQCSIGMVGVDQNVPGAATLLWDTEYGPRERGGSEPGRVARYSAKRGIRIFNITGPQTYQWMKWACANGRGCAVGCGSAHFQTLAGHDPKTSTWYVVNNNGDQRVDVYSDAQFRRLHEASGEWCVILDYPAHPARPAYRKWW